MVEMSDENANKYVFTDVAWAMYQLIPDKFKPAFWEAFADDGCDEYELITHDMVQASSEKFLDQCPFFDCPEYISLVKRCEEYINHSFVIKIPRRLHNYFTDSRPDIDVEYTEPPPTLVYFKGEPYQFSHDVDVIHAALNIFFGIIAANPTYYTTNEDSSWKVEYAKYFHKVTRRFEFEQELKARLVEITGQ